LNPLNVFVTPVISKADDKSDFSASIDEIGNENFPFVLHLGQLIKILSPGSPLTVILFLHLGHIIFF
jgi:hypothetical protein